jgi:hypothetical protein
MLYKHGFLTPSLSFRKLRIFLGSGPALLMCTDNALPIWCKVVWIKVRWWWCISLKIWCLHTNPCASCPTKCRTLSAVQETEVLHMHAVVYKAIMVTELNVEAIHWLGNRVGVPPPHLTVLIIQYTALMCEGVNMMCWHLKGAYVSHTYPELMTSTMTVMKQSCMN